MPTGFHDGPELPGGYRIQMANGLASGTLGGWFRHREHGPVLLSNQHVLSRANSSIFHSKVGERQIGTVLKVAGNCDAAIGIPISQDIVSRRVADIPMISGIVAPKDKMKVFMDGAVSGKGYGIITKMDLGPSRYGQLGSFGFDIVMLSEQEGNPAWGAFGDSGTLIIEQITNRAVGLYFGDKSASQGEPRRGKAHPLTAVADELNFEPLPA